MRRRGSNKKKIDRVGGVPSSVYPGATGVGGRWEATWRDFIGGIKNYGWYFANPVIRVTPFGLFLAWELLGSTGNRAEYRKTRGCE